MKEIYIGRGVYVKVDAADYEWASGYTWGIHSQGYAIRSMPNGKGRKIFMHREIVGATRGQLVDHVNRDVTDNRRCNLRRACSSGNARNKRKMKNNTSGYVGVYSTPGGRWRASIWVKRKKIPLGHFGTKEEAAIARDAAAKRLHQEFARLNFD